MPFLPGKRTTGDLTVVASPEQLPYEPEFHPSWGTDIVPSFLATENTIGSTIEKSRSAPQIGVQNPEFDPFERIAGTELETESNNFIDVDTEDEFNLVQTRLNRQIKDRSNLAAASLPQMAGMFALGMLDPLVLVPVGEAAVFSKGIGLLKRGMLTARAGMYGVSAQEAVLQSTQDLRTWGESALTIGAGTVLSGAIGGSMEALHLGAEVAVALGMTDEAVDAARMRAVREAEAVVEADLGSEPSVVLGDTAVAGASGAAPSGVAIPSGRLRKPGPHTPRTAPPIAPPAAPVASDELRTLPAWGGLDRVLSRFTPLIQVTTQAASKKARELAVRMARVPHFVKTSAALPHSAEALADQHYRGLAEWLSDLRQQFSQYRLGRAAQPFDRKLAFTQLREGVTGRRADPGKMTFREFREEVGFALNNKDQHYIPEVAASAAMARAKVLDPILDRAIAVGLADQALKTTPPKGADSFFPRHYRHEEVNARREGIGGLADRIHQWVQQNNPTMTTDEVRAATADAIDNVVGMNPSLLTFEGMTGTLSRSFKERAWDIPHVLISDFIEYDAEKVLRAYVRGASREVEMHGMFGSTTLKDQLAEVADEYRALLANATPDEVDALTKERDRTMQSLTTLRDIVLGTYGRPPDPNSLIVRGAQFARQFNFVTLGGGFAINSIADIGNLVMTYGASRVFGTIAGAMIRDFPNYARAAKQMAVDANIWEFVLNSRVNTSYEIDAGNMAHTKLERGMGALSQNMSLVNLQTHWNQTVKSAVALLGTKGYRDMANAARSWTLTVKQLAWLDRAGIESRGKGSMAERIAEQFDQHSVETNGVLTAETAKWTDREAADAFRIALSGDANRVVVTPEAGDMPAWMHKETAKFFGQFKAFQMATTSKILLANMQMPDAQALSGLMAGIALGSMVYGLRRKLNGQETSDNPLVWIKEGVDRSGVTGFFFDINNIAERATSGALGINRLIGGPISSRYASLNAAGSVMGPTAGQLQNIYQILAATAQMDFDPTDTKAIRRMIPYQNIFYTEKLFDLFQTGLEETIVPEKTLRRAHRRQRGARPMRLEANP